MLTTSLCVLRKLHESSLDYKAEFDLLDANRDGTISRANFAAVFGLGSFAEFDILDTDKDGKLSEAEYMAAYGRDGRLASGKVVSQESSSHKMQQATKGTIFFKMGGDVVMDLDVHNKTDSDNQKCAASSDRLKPISKCPIVCRSCR